MTILVFYSVLLAFWIENSFHFNPGDFFGLSMGLSLKNLSFVLLLCAWLIACKKQGKLWHHVKINKYLLVFIYIMVLSIPLKFLDQGMSKSIVLGESIGIKHFIEDWFCFVIVLHILNNKRLCKLAVYGVFVLMIVTIITSLLQKYSGVDLGIYRPTYYAHRGRIAGFGEANQYAGFLVLLLPLPLTFLMFKRNLHDRIIWFFLFGVGMVGLLSTVSRGGYLAFCFSVLVLLVLSKKYSLIRGDRVMVFLILLPLMIGAAYFLAPKWSKKKIQERVLMSQKEEDIKDELDYDNGGWRYGIVIDKYTSGRFSRSVKSFGLFFEKPFLGHGNDASHRLFNFSTHNDYLQILVNYGVIGFFVWIIIYLNLLKYFYLRFKDTSQMSTKILCLGYISGLCGYMLAMAAVNMLETRYLFWLYTGVMYRYVED